MAELYHTGDKPQYFCWDRKYYESVEDQLKTLAESKTIYIGNMSFYTTEVQIHETFSLAGPINRIIMGLNMNTKEPCGFCFVEFFTREAAAAALNYVNNTICDDRILRCDLDGGFRPGRQFGRGKSGGQRRDDYRTEYDPGRGDTEEVRDQVHALRKRRVFHENYDRNRPKRSYRPKIEITVINPNVDPLNAPLMASRGNMMEDGK
jgi:nuclear cap-binding protein subunit 2